MLRGIARDRCVGRIGRDERRGGAVERRLGRAEIGGEHVRAGELGDLVGIIGRRFGPHAPRIVAILFAGSAIALAVGLIVFQDR